MSNTRNLVSLGCAIAAATFFLNIEISGMTAWSATSAAPHATSLTPHNVDRASKGDRLLLIPALKPINANGRTGTSDGSAVAPKLPDGCESIISEIGQPTLARVAGRCVS